MIEDFWRCLEKIVRKKGYELQEIDSTLPFLFLVEDVVYLPRLELEEKVYLLYAFLFNEIIEFEISEEERMRRILGKLG